VSTAAGVIGTACPYCRTMLEDGVKYFDMENPPKIFDVIELVASSL
jgi:Fe-S oxidoreductase